MKTSAPTFPLNSTVYHRIRPGIPGMVTGRMERPGGVFIYYVTWQADEMEERCHYFSELSDEKVYTNDE